MDQEQETIPVMIENIPIRLASGYPGNDEELRSAAWERTAETVAALTLPSPEACLEQAEREGAQPRLQKAVAKFLLSYFPDVHMRKTIADYIELDEQVNQRIFAEVPVLSPAIRERRISVEQLENELHKSGHSSQAKPLRSYYDRFLA